MSTNNPRGPRRRIAGERRPGRPAQGAGGTGAADTGAQDDTHDDTQDSAQDGVPGGAPVGPDEQPALGGATSAELHPDAPGTGHSPVLEGTATAPHGTRRLGSGPPWWVVGVLGVVALALVLTAAWLGLHTWDYRQVQRADEVEEASRTAPAVAERAAATVLSYSYTSLDADEKAAERYLTPSFRKQYVSSMKLVRPNAPKLKAKVVAEVKGSGVSHADPDRVDVLVYVDQTTTSTANGGDPQVALNRAMFSMVRRDGSWLVDKITSY